jgi:Flp pilus assembly protein TadG
MFGLTLIPLGGLVGIALDYNRAIELRTFMHRETDSAALSIASSDAPNTDAVIGGLKTRIAAHFGSDSTDVSNISTASSWEGASRFTMTTTATLSMTLSAILPSGIGSIPLSVTTTVQRNAPQFKWSLPTVKDLSNEAWDYNRISVYCYDESKKNTATKGRRLETLTPISDNYGTDYSASKMPTCEAGETLSYKFWNVRNGKEPGKTANLKWWRKNSSGQDPETVMSARYPTQTDYYSFYTDTTIDPNTRVVTNNVSGGKEDSKGVINTASDVTSSPLVETALCTTNVDCRPLSDGGLLPNLGVKNKTKPQTASGACSEGKSMYYGWEDRPPSAGGSDRDYDDIRLVVSCPTLEKVGAKEVRIIR